MTISHWQKNIKLNTDILIVGAGIAGLSTAYWLNKKNPDLKITILDENNVFSGTSGRNAGFLSLGGVSFLERDLLNNNGKNIIDIKENILLLEKEIINVNKKGFDKNGTSLLFDDDEMDRYLKLSSELNKIKIKNKIVKDKIINKNVLWYEDAYSVNPISIRDGIMSLLNHNVEFRLGISFIENKEKEAITSMGSIFYDKIIFCTGAFYKSKELKLTPTRAQCMTFKLKSKLKLKGNYSYARKGMYFRLDNDFLIIGGSRMLDMDRELTSIDDINVLIQEELKKFVLTNISKNVRIDSQWSGILAYTPEKLPLIKQKSDEYYLVGLSGHGVAFSFKYGKDLSNLILL